MRRPPLNALTLSALLALIPAAHAQDSSDFFKPAETDLSDPRVKMVRVQVEWIEVPHQTFTRLMWERGGRGEASPYRPSDETPLRRKVAELVEEDEARILDTAMVTALSARRFRAESGKEHIHPTKYGTPSNANAAADATDDDAPADAVDAQGGPLIRGDGLPIAAAFETRTVGTVLEVDGIVTPDGLHIDMQIAPEITYLAGETEWGTHRSGEGEVSIKMPSFYSMKLQTTLAVAPGEYILVGVVSPHDSETGVPDRERKVMVFAMADVLAVGPPPGDKASDPE